MFKAELNETTGWPAPMWTSAAAAWLAAAGTMAAYLRWLGGAHMPDIDHWVILGRNVAAGATPYAGEVIDIKPPLFGLVNIAAGLTGATGLVLWVLTALASATVVMQTHSLVNDRLKRQWAPPLAAVVVFLGIAELGLYPNNKILAAVPLFAALQTDRDTVSGALVGGSVFLSQLHLIALPVFVWIWWRRDGLFYAGCGLTALPAAVVVFFAAVWGWETAWDSLYWSFGIALQYIFASVGSVSQVANLSGGADAAGQPARYIAKLFDIISALRWPLLIISVASIWSRGVVLRQWPVYTALGVLLTLTLTVRTSPHYVIPVLPVIGLLTAGSVAWGVEQADGIDI